MRLLSGFRFHQGDDVGFEFLCCFADDSCLGFLCVAAIAVPVEDRCGGDFGYGWGSRDPEYFLERISAQVVPGVAPSVIDDGVRGGGYHGLSRDAKHFAPSILWLQFEVVCT